MKRFLDRFGRKRLLLVVALFVAIITWALLAAETGDDQASTFDKIGIGVLLAGLIGAAGAGSSSG